MDNLLEVCETDYLLVRYNALASVAALGLEILEEKEGKELSDEIGSIIMIIAFHEDDITEFLIKRDSLLGKFILNPKRKRYIRCIDAYIEYEDLFNAFMFASINKNLDMAAKIKEMLNSNSYGFIAELKEKFDLELLLYIYNSKTLKDFMFNNVKNSSKFYYVYDEGLISSIRSTRSYTLHL